MPLPYVYNTIASLVRQILSLLINHKSLPNKYILLIHSTHITVTLVLFLNYFWMSNLHWNSLRIQVSLFSFLFFYVDNGLRNTLGYSCINASRGDSRIWPAGVPVDEDLQPLSTILLSVRRGCCNGLLG